MGISFSRPFILLLIPLFIAAIILSAKGLSKMEKTRRITAVSLRCIIVSLLILVYAGTNLLWKVDKTATIFLLDASDSVVTSRKDMEGFIREAARYMKERDQIAVISFGANSQVESFISKELNFSGVEGNINGNYTNIENAIAAAISIFPENSKKRLVVLSDGEENAGTSNNVVSSLQQQGIDIKYYKVKKSASAEVAVEKVSVPQTLALGQEFNLNVTINSSSDQAAKLNLFSGRTKVGEQEVQLNKGINKFIFKDKASIGGFKSYKVVIEAVNDTETKNNEGSAFTNITDKPKVLVLQDIKEDAEELIKILEASSMDYTVVNSKAAPRTLTEMTAYKSIIACNVSADNLNEGFLSSLESYVKDFGGGFVAAGGDNSFALGGYTKTSLEKVLPVYMDMKGKKEIPKMAMVLIIDKSGSMTEGAAGITRVDMAKEAAIRSLESLRPSKDEIGVLAFDDSYSWVVKRKVIDDIEVIGEEIGTIRAGGGTSILPALEEGYKALKESDAKLKHIILLTDGQAEKYGYENLLKEINSENITVSTVAVGQGADVSLLQAIALECGGRHYITDEFTNIPRIFSKETFMASRSYLNNREFTPAVNSDHLILRGVAEEGLPPLLGYVGASQKEMARVLLSSDEEDPILTVWQYGLGKTAAWNSDISGRWSANYIPWDRNMKLWQNIIDYTLENYDDSSASIEVENAGSKAKITFKDKVNKEEIDTVATIITPSGESKEVKLYPSAPGEYSTEFDLQDIGVYMINGKQEKGGEIISAINTGYVQQYSPEYRINRSSEAFDRLIEGIGGKIITTPEEVFAGNISSRKGSRDLTPYLLALVLVLFIFDVAVRRLRISKDKLIKFFEKIKLLLPAINIKRRQPKSAYKDNSYTSKIIPENNISSYEKEFIKEEYKLEPQDKEKGETKKAKSDDESASITLDTSKLLKNKKFKK